MRKLWYAGAAVASGFLLFAASPAQADVQPAGSAAPSDLLPGNSIAPPSGDLLSGAGGWAVTQVSGAGRMATAGAGNAMSGADTAAGEARNGLDRVRRPTNNRHLTVPLDGSRPLSQVHSPLLADQQQAPEGLPSADAIGPLDPSSALTGSGGGGDLLGGGLLGQLPLLSGVMPDGQQQSFDSLDRPTAGDDSPFADSDGETESAEGGMPLLGGLGGMLPVDGLPAVPGGDVPDVGGLPGGGVAVLAPAATDPAAADPADTDPAATDPTAAAPSAVAPAVSAPAVSAPAKHKDKVKPAASPSADSADPRLHEEPIDGEAAQRTFSPNGRPVAGVDQQNK